MVNCLILHGCPQSATESGKKNSEGHWLPWLRDQMNSKGIKSETPELPVPWKPVYEKFKEAFEKYEVNEGTILIGHSCACAFLVRWLGETKKKINKLILVAPWKIAEKSDDPNRPEEMYKLFYEYPIDETIKSRVNKIVMFTADDEEEDGKKSLEIYHKALGGKLIELKGHGHYTLGDMGTIEFPELLEECLN